MHCTSSWTAEGVPPKFCTICITTSEIPSFWNVQSRVLTASHLPSWEHLLVAMEEATKERCSREQDRRTSVPWEVLGHKKPSLISWRQHPSQTSYVHPRNRKMKEVGILIIIVTHAIEIYTRVWPSNYLCIVVWSQYVYVAGDWRHYMLIAPTWLFYQYSTFHCYFFPSYWTVTFS